MITGKPIKTRESFIESLTHDSYIIQIPKLTQKRRNELEILLSVFDQSSSVEPYHHILNIKEDDYPKKYSHLIRRLQKAVSDGEMKKRMDFEDGMLDDLKEMQRSIKTLEQKTKMISEEKDRIAEEKDRIAEENAELKRRLAELDMSNA